jgi:dipeptidase
MLFDGKRIGHDLAADRQAASNGVAVARPADIWMLSMRALAWASLASQWLFRAAPRA